MLLLRELTDKAALGSLSPVNAPSFNPYRVFARKFSLPTRPNFFTRWLVRDMCDISSSHYSYENPSLPAIDVVAKLTPKKCLTVLFFISSSSSPTADQVTQHVQSATDILRDKWSSSKPPTLHHDTVPPSSAQDLKDEIQQEIQKIPQQDAAAPPPPGLSAYGDEDYGTSLNPEPVKKLPTAKAPGPRMNATFVTLARNSDVWEISESIRQVEDRFNDKFGYDWVFLNDEPFDDEFKQVTTKLVSGKTKYGLIPKEHWSFPEWIDQDKAAAVRKKMEEDQIIYGGSISYRHMCRFESGFFFRQPLMNEYEYYWRVEPSIKLFCDIDYDVFKYMADNKKKYSFVLSLYEYRETIPTLWDSVKSFMKENPQYIAKDNSMPFLSDDGGNEYNHCHFVSHRQP